MGFEPTTASLEGWNSTTELRPPTAPQQIPSCHGLLNSAPFRANQTQRITHSTPLACSAPALGAEAEPARYGGQARIRTLEDISQQIYSLPPLATWVPAPPAPGSIYNFSTHVRSNQTNHSLEQPHLPSAENESKPHHAQLPSETTGLEC